MVLAAGHCSSCYLCLIDTVLTCYKGICVAQKLPVSLWLNFWPHSTAQEGNSRFTPSFCSCWRDGVCAVSCLLWSRCEWTNHCPRFPACPSILLKTPGKASHVPKPRASDIQRCTEWMLHHYREFRSAASTKGSFSLTPWKSNDKTTQGLMLLTAASIWGIQDSKAVKRLI